MTDRVADLSAETGYDLTDPDVVAGLARMAHAKVAAGVPVAGRAERYALTQHPLTPSLWPDGEPYGPEIPDARPAPTGGRDVTPGPGSPTAVGGDETLPYDRAIAGSETAAQRWTDEQKLLVDQAIEETARTHPTFTTDAVWAYLGPDFPVTKGMTSRLNKAVRDGLIVNTGTTRIADRGGPHDHAQRLVIWASTHPLEESA